MVYKGRVRQGRIELEGGTVLPDGVRVLVEAVEESADPADGLGEEAVVTDLTDLASQHDHYAYGTPKDEA